MRTYGGYPSYHPNYAPAVSFRAPARVRRPHRVHLSASTPAVSFRVQPLVYHPHHIYSAATACVSPPLHLSERNRSLVTPTISIRAPVLAPRRVFSRTTARVSSRCIYSSASTRSLAPPCLFERNRPPDARHLRAYCTCPRLVLSQVPVPVVCPTSQNTVHIFVALIRQHYNEDLKNSCDGSKFHDGLDFYGAAGSNLRD